MDWYLFVRLVHILGAAILFGTGIGIAWFMLFADRTHDARVIAATARIVVGADMIFTATAALLQPVTGSVLVYWAGHSFLDLWVWLSIVLYLVIGACWLPVVWLQIRMRNLAEAAIAMNAPLGEEYHRYMRIWFLLGWPAFTSIIAIFGLMVFKPV